jgi:DNA-binding response OmpR family regulator
MASKLNITVVEDHDALRAVTIEALRQQGHKVQGIACAEAIDDEAASAPSDLFIIDVNLPGEDGLSLSKRIRRGNPRAGIIMATGRTHVGDRIAGYENGADVYLSKPVEMEELLAAVSAVSRRADMWQSQPQAEEGFIVDSRSLTLSGPKGTTVISASELRMLIAFSTSHARQLEYWQIMELLGHSPEDFRKASLEVKIVRLRKKLVQVGADLGCLRSIRLVGYQLCISLKIT